MPSKQTTLSLRKNSLGLRLAFIHKSPETTAEPTKYSKKPLQPLRPRTPAAAPRARAATLRLRGIELVATPTDVLA